MSIINMMPYATLAELQALKEPVALGANTIVAAPTVTLDNTPVQTTPAPATPNPLVSALNQTLLEFGLSTPPLPAAGTTGAVTNSTTPANDDGAAASANATQVTQNFLGALYQAAANAQAATTVSTNTAANDAAAVNAASAAATAPAEAQTAYTGTQFNLATVLQQIESNPGNTAQAGTSSTQNADSNALQTLQANFESLLNTASDVNSQAAAATNSASLTLQNFVQTLAQNIPDQVSPVSAIGPQGNLIQTEV